MINSRTVLLLTVAISVCLQQTDGINPRLLTTIPEVMFEVTKLILKGQKIIGHYTSVNNIPHPLFDRAEKDLFSRLEKIDLNLDYLTRRSEAQESTVVQLINNLPRRLQLELRLNDLNDYTTRIDVNYRRMQHYVREKDDIEKSTLTDFAKNVVSHDSSSIVNLLERIFAFLSTGRRGITDNGILYSLGGSLMMLPNDLDFATRNLEGIWAFAVVSADMKSIQAMYATFRRFQTLQTAPGKVPSPRKAWTQLAEAIQTDPNNRVDESLVRMEGIVANGLFRSVAQELEGLRCDTNQSSQQVLYNLYNSIALTELKGYTMIQFSYMLLRLYNEGNFTKEAQQQQERFESRSNAAVYAVKSAMDSVSRDLYRCDPRKHIAGQTFDQITQLIQGYVQNEVDLNPEGTCRENCAEYKYTKSYGCFKNLYCRQQRSCTGKILNCQYVDSDMWICPASPLSGRRYEYIKYENGETLGRDVGCYRGTTKVDSWWRWLFWHCSYCMCLCDEAGPNSDRFFNLRPVVSNITNNKVVTGLRFKKVNRVFHLQIQEGVLMPYGKIDEETLRWVPVDSYKITDKTVENGRDYHQMSWEKRAIDLDDLVADKGYVLTGVKFKLIGSHLNFEIRVSPFDFKNGTLIDPINKSIWKDNPNTDSSLKNPRKRLTLYKPDIPTRTASPSIPDSSSDQYIEFVNSDMNKDAAQTTVPFIDIQPVQSLIATPLSGAGIFHKGRPDYGGFITPKIITYDFSEHLQAVFPEEEIVENNHNVEMN